MICWNHIGDSEGDNRWEVGEEEGNGINVDRVYILDTVCNCTPNAVIIMNNDRCVASWVVLNDQVVVASSWSTSTHYVHFHPQIRANYAWSYRIISRSRHLPKEHWKDGKEDVLVYTVLRDDWFIDTYLGCLLATGHLSRRRRDSIRTRVQQILRCALHDKTVRRVTL